jgi:hypothetical protein
VTTKATGSETIKLGSVDLLQGVADPSTGSGVPAPVGSFYLRTTGEQWSKTGVSDTAWTLVGGGGGGAGFQGPWSAGTYPAGSVVTASDFTFGTATTTSVAPITTITAPAVTDTTAWQYNDNATTLVGPPPCGQLINNAGQQGSINRKVTFNLDTYLEIDCAISASHITAAIADAYYIGILDAAYPATTPVVIAGTASPGFWGVQFQLYGTQYVVPIVGGAVGGSQVVHSTETANSGTYYAYKVIFNTFAGMCMLSVVQDGVVLFRQFLAAPPSFTSARLAIGAWSGGIGADIRVGDVVTTTAPVAPWQKLP